MLSWTVSGSGASPRTVRGIDAAGTAFIVLVTTVTVV
jgi:hypothetical protein